MIGALQTRSRTHENRLLAFFVSSVAATDDDDDDENAQANCAFCYVSFFCADRCRLHRDSNRPSHSGTIQSVRCCTKAIPQLLLMHSSERNVSLTVSGFRCRAAVSLYLILCTFFRYKNATVQCCCGDNGHRTSSTIIRRYIAEWFVRGILEWMIVASLNLWSQVYLLPNKTPNAYEGNGGGHVPIALCALFIHGKLVGRRVDTSALRWVGFEARINAK